MLRTPCFGCMSLRVRTWTSLTSPSGVVTTRAERMPVSVVIKFSIRFMPQGSGVPPPVPPPRGNGSWSEAGEGFDVTVPLRLPPDSDRLPSHDTARDRPPPAPPHPSFRAGPRPHQSPPLRALSDSPSLFRFPGP